MSNDGSPPPTPTTAGNRRASFAPGQKLSELFSRSPPTTNGTTAYPGPIATAAANAQAQQRRRTSVNLGLGSSPTSQTSPFSAHARNRRTSFGSSSSPSGSIEESAIEEGDAPASPPTSPFVRRMSFGARALRDARNGGATGNANGRASNSMASAPSVKGRGLSLGQSLSYPCLRLECGLTVRYCIRRRVRLVRRNQESR